MSAQGTPSDSALERLYRVQQLSWSLPAEPRSVDQPPTLSFREQAFIESPDNAANTTPINRSALPTVKAPQVVGNYEVQTVVGRGGMGWVFKGIDRRLDRTVALKMLIGNATLEPTIARRFAVESKALRDSNTPNIVPVYEASDWDGVPYFSMKYVSGGTLAENAKRLRLDLKAAVRVMAKVARAVGYLHDQGILHRDLKPANILIGEGDEPLVADFGLAKFQGTDSELTITGCLIGTRSYMPPEQTRGHYESAPTCDTWSIGVVLYELISGKVPFQARGEEEVLYQIRVAEPPPLTTEAGEPVPELDAVVRRCLAKNPAARYPSATALAEDLERWLDGKKVQAPAAPRRWRSKPALAALAASLLVCLGVAAFFSKSEEPSTTLLGETKPDAEFAPLGDPNARVGSNPQGRLTFQSSRTAMLPLGRANYPNGTRIEAMVQQLTAESDNATAGLYFRGRMVSPGGPLYAIALNIESVCLNPPDNLIGTGIARLQVLRWDPSQRQKFNFPPLGEAMTFGRTQLDPARANAGPIQRLTIDIKPDGSVDSAINGKVRLPVAEPAELTRSLGYAVLRVKPPPAVPPDYGDEIGLIVESCQAAFWNVSVRPLAP